MIVHLKYCHKQRGCRVLGMIFCPLPGTPLITQGFGQNPDRYAPFGLKGHDGIDFETTDGTPVYAPHDGIATVKDDGANGMAPINHAFCD